MQFEILYVAQRFSTHSRSDGKRVTPCMSCDADTLPVWCPLLLLLFTQWSIGVVEESKWEVNQVLPARMEGQKLIARDHTWYEYGT